VHHRAGRYRFRAQRLGSLGRVAGCGHFPEFQLYGPGLFQTGVFQRRSGVGLQTSLEAIPAKNAAKSGHVTGAIFPISLAYMRQNVIILTSGLTGSSVLTGLISRCGYWMGDASFKKEYDTHENRELIQLNRRIFEQAGYSVDHLTEFSGDALQRIESIPDDAESEPYRKFLKTCAAHQPWIWKDPRLWLTIRFWKRFLDLKSCKFIVLTRGSRQLWVSAILRRKIISYRDSRAHEAHIRRSAIDFLQSHRASYLEVRYEDLIVRPEESIRKLNAFLGTSLSVEDLKSVYYKPLYKTPRNSAFDFVKAALIYLKNYSQRIEVLTSRKTRDRVVI